MATRRGQVADHSGNRNDSSCVSLADVSCSGRMTFGEFDTYPTVFLCDLLCRFGRRTD